LYTPHTLSACLLLFKVAKLELETRVRERPNPKPRFGNTSCIRSRQPGPDRHRVSGPGSRDRRHRGYPVRIPSVSPVPAAGTRSGAFRSRQPGLDLGPSSPGSHN